MIARLISKMAPQEFYSTIQNRPAERCTINDITIGHSFNSTTVVPKVCCIRGLHLCDMPGFAETNPQKRISIDILQKCFLTRVPNSTFLVVVDVGCLKEPKANTLLHHYHGDLQTLLGSRYANSIDRLYFLLTKNDQHEMSSSEILEKLRDIQDDLVDDDFVAARFLKRMRKHHVIVDLKNDDDVALLKRINNLVDSDLDTKRKLHKETDWQIDSLKGGENALIQMTLSHISFLRDKCEQFVDEIDALKEQFGRRRADLTSVFDAIQAETLSLQDSHEQLTKEQSDTARDIELYEERKAAMASKLQDAKDLLSSHEKQTKVFQEEFVSSDFVSLRSDVAKAAHKKLQNKSEYKLQLNAVIAADGSKDHVFLITNHESNDETLRKFIGCNGSLIPEDLADVRDIDLPVVLFNSHRMINRCNAEVEMNDGTLSVRVIHPKPFKIFIYSARPFKEHQIFSKFKGIVEDYVRQDKAQIASLKEENQKLDTTRESNIARVREIKGLLVELEEMSNALDQKLLSLGVEHDDRYTGMKYAVLQKQERQASLAGDPSIERLATIDRILTENKIDSEISDQMEELRMSLRPLQSHVDELFKYVGRMEVEGKELLDEVSSGRARIGQGNWCPTDT